MGITRYLQDYLEEVYDDNILEDSKAKKAKAIGAAFLSGAIDGAVFVYPFLMVSCVMATKELKKLKGE